jgi:hypothetical protein
MMLSRREFLKLGTYVLSVTKASRAKPFYAIFENQRKARDLSNRDLSLLGSAMDVIVPAGDGMPSATAAGCVRYLENLAWQYPTILDEVRQFSDAVKKVSSTTIHGEFDSVSPDQRLQVMKILEKQDAATLSAFVAYVYEAYYTRPQVLGLIVCPNQPEDDDLERLLAPVRAMKPLYKEARGEQY